MRQKQPQRPSYRESIKALEADIQHANTLTAALSKYRSGDFIQMKLAYGPLAPFFSFLVEWLDCNCTDNFLSYLGLVHILVYKVNVDGMSGMSSLERKATLKEFYSVIYPLLRQLNGDCIKPEDHNKKNHCPNVGDEECGICMESCSMMALPSCGHSMCIGCYHDWNARSRSCPFCRGSLRRVGSQDLWVLTSYSEIIDTVSLAKDSLRCFYLYIENLPPLTMPDITPLFVCDYII